MYVLLPPAFDGYCKQLTHGQRVYAVELPTPPDSAKSKRLSASYT